MTESPNLLWRSAIAAFAVEFLFLSVVGYQGHWLAHPQANTSLDTTKFIEAEVFQPVASHLTEEKPQTAKAPKEAVLSKVPGRGKKSKTQNPLQQKNQIATGPKLAPTHGPVAVFAPPPTIPMYLRDQVLKATAVIDFYVNALGGVTPRLVGTTGNEELDQVALRAVSKWVFRPAEENHKPVDSKVRLRIVFEVQ